MLSMNVIGLMSGTSLDGLDIALVRIESDLEEGNKQPLSEVRYRLLASETVAYSPQWVQRLSTLEHASAYEYALANVQLGHYFGQCVNAFIGRNPHPVDLVASHGHTIFHQPHLELTTQIGDGDAIAAETHLPVVSNFRTLDVALGGQGAPLVPIGDRLLFGHFDACLNLGGIANISYESNHRVAFDISPCNMALNHLARRAGMPYDKDGVMARSGRVDGALLERMNALEYYRLSAPKSLGKEWFVEHFLPLLQASLPIADLMRTSVEHIAQMIVWHMDKLSVKEEISILVTGGGAMNKFLIERMQELSPKSRIVVPSEEVINYKEAIIFALLGYLRVNHQTNTLSSVTGASADSIGGTLSGLF